MISCIQGVSSLQCLGKFQLISCNFAMKTYFWVTSFQVRQLLSDFAVLISIVVMVGIDMAIGIGTPKLEVPTEFVVSILQKIL